MSFLLLLKLTLVPCLIAAVTLAGRQWGAHVAGWLSAFPVVGAPILFFIAQEQGRDFAATAATGTFSAIVAIIIFGLVYAWSALRFNWFICLLLALSVYFLTLYCVAIANLELSLAALVNALALLITPRLYPHVIATDISKEPTAIELPLRMIAGICLVLSITYFAQHLGARLSGILTMFPVMGSILAVFSHRNISREFAIQVMRGSLLGWYAFAAFSFLLASLLPATSIANAFSIALLSAFAVQLLSMNFIRRF